MERTIIEVGQTWQDNDPRHAKRRLTVARIEGEYAFCRVRGGRVTRVRLDRFKPNSTGYRLVK